MDAQTTVDVLVVMFFMGVTISFGALFGLAVFGFIKNAVKGGRK